MPLASDSHSRPKIWQPSHFPFKTLPVSLHTMP